MKIGRVTLSIGTLAVCAALSSSVLAGGKGKDIVSTAVEAGSFKTLAAALSAAELVETLQGEGPFTVFAPTDDAFAALPAGTVETLLKPENKDQLVAILKYHVVAGKVPAEAVVKLNAAETVNGQRVDVKVESSEVTVDGAKVVKTDIECSNGIIHVIDAVILPSADKIPATADKAGTFKTLLAAAKAAGLVDVLSGDEPLTVFAPTDEAFAKLPKGTIDELLKPANKEKLAAILKLHVVTGRVFSPDVLANKGLKTVQGATLKAEVVDGSPKINGSGIVATDIDAANGVIHVIDTVILPPKTTAATHKKAATRVVKHVCATTGNVTYTTVSVP